MSEKISLDSSERIYICYLLTSYINRGYNLYPKIPPLFFCFADYNYICDVFLRFLTKRQ